MQLTCYCHVLRTLNPFAAEFWDDALCIWLKKNEPRVPRHTHVTGSRIGKLALTPLSQEMFSNLIELSEGAAPLRTKAPHPFTVYTVHSFVARGDYGKSLSTPFLLALSSPSPLSSPLLSSSPMGDFKRGRKRDSPLSRRDGSSQCRRIAHKNNSLNSENRDPKALSFVGGAE